MSGSYKNRIRLVEDGQAVNASVTNSPTQDLDQNIRYLKALFEQASLGQCLVIPNVTVERDAAVGHALYYNATTKQYERALAGADTDPVTQALLATESSLVWGVLQKKTSATSGDLLISGYAALDISAVVDGSFAAGWYFLSGQNPGQLTSARPYLGVFVLFADGEGNVMVNPTIRDSVEDHRHYKFELVCQPAGDTTPPPLGGQHTITNADNTLEGWLPADDPIFEGHAPTNAVFGYNIAASALNNLWPPLPLQSACLEWNRGEDPTQGEVGVPLGSDQLCIINRYGIWWLSNCYGDVPWRTSLSTVDGSDTSEGYDDSDAIECPRKTFMTMTLWFTRLIFKTSGAVVTSLRAADGSLLTVRCVDGSDGSTGDLEVSLDLNFEQEASDTRGHVVLKSLQGNKFSRGPVIEGVRVQGGNLTATSTASREIDGDTYHQGLVSLTANLDVDGYELPVNLVRVDDVTEEYYKDVMALGFREDKDSTIRCRLDVPVNNIPDGVSLKLRFWLLARGAGTTPGMALSYRRVPAVSSPTALPVSDTNLADLVGVTIDAADKYYQVESEEFSVTAGDIVFFSLTREAAAGDGFTDPILVLKMRGIIVAS